jgi:hypothetical protein
MAGPKPAAFPLGYIPTKNTIKKFFSNPHFFQNFFNLRNFLRQSEIGKI